MLRFPNQVVLRPPDQDSRILCSTIIYVKMLEVKVQGQCSFIRPQIASWTSNRTAERIKKRFIDP